MCDFPSWIKRADGTVLFATNKDIEKLSGSQPPDMNDTIGHHWLRGHYGSEPGDTEGEGFPCPPDVAGAIRAGRCRRMMQAGGYVAIHVTADDKLHREDGPAIERTNGDREWYRNGKRHREDGPAIEDEDGDRKWYRNGERHREDGPAIERTDGDRAWFLNGKLHREGGPAVERADGDKEWYQNGELHREGGPAVERADGDKEWYQNGKLVDDMENPHSPR